MYPEYPLAYEKKCKIIYNIYRTIYNYIKEYLPGGLIKYNFIKY